MQVFLIVAPVFALIAIGYAAARAGLLPDVAHKWTATSVALRQ